MEFRFNINEIFKTPVVEIGYNLIPPGFQGDRRQLWEVVTKVSEVINTIGQASASAQGLTKPITTSERLRNAENQKLYLLIDRDLKTGKGFVTGMLKTGKKGLYVFDREGHHYQVQPNCVLDFYIHESRQRTGLGKRLFEHMLQKEEVEPVKLAIDRPSDKFLAFLKKHYNLDSAIRQMNNYVVFEGFFPKEEKEKLMSQQHHTTNNNTETPTNRMTTTIPLDKRGSNGLQQNSVTSPYGRYGAPRPPCSMGQIIHNQSAVVGAQEPSGCSINMTPSKERSIHTLRRGSRHMSEEMRKQYYSAPRLPFTPCAAVGNGLGNSPASYVTNPNQVSCSPTLQESNIQLVTKEHMMQVASERQKQQMTTDRPQSILQNLPSPSPSKIVNSPSKSSINNLQNVSLIQQNVRVLDKGPNSPLVSSPSGMQYYRPNQQQYMQSPQQSVTPSSVYTSESRITRPKSSITEPSKDYITNTIVQPVAVNATNNNVQNYQNPTQLVQQVQQPVVPNQQQYGPQQSVESNNANSPNNSPRVHHWQNQIYQSRDAPTNYPFVGNQNNPNRFYLSHEECGECMKQQGEAPAVQYNSVVDQNANRIGGTDQKLFPNDFQLQQVQQQGVMQNQLGYSPSQQQQQQSIVPPSEGQRNNAVQQQTYQLNSQNINLAPDNQHMKHPQGEVQQKVNLCQMHQLQQQQQQQQQQPEYNNMMQNQINNGSNANLYPPQALPTIAETESEQMVSAKESLPQQNIDSMTPQQNKSEFDANVPITQVTQDIPIDIERKPALQEYFPITNENVKVNNIESPQQQQYFNQYNRTNQGEPIQHSPRYNQNNVSSAVTSQNIGDFDVQSPRLNQYLVQQQQAQNLTPQEQYQTSYNKFDEHQKNVPAVDYSQQYLPYPKQDIQNIHMRPLSSHPTTMQNVGNFEQQSPRMNLTIPTSLPKEEYICHAPRDYQPKEREVHYQKPRPIPSNERQASQPQERIPSRHGSHKDKASTDNLKSSNANRSYSPKNPVHRNPITHLEYNYTPVVVPKFEIAPNDKSEQVKPYCLPERTPRLNSDQASASTQINIPKNVANAQPISPGYNNLATDTYKHLQQSQQQDGFGSGKGVLNQPSGHGLINGRRDVKSGLQQQRESRYECYGPSANKTDEPHTPNMKGDMMAIPNGGQQRPVEIRPEITSQ